MQPCLAWNSLVSQTGLELRTQSSLLVWTYSHSTLYLTWERKLKKYFYYKSDQESLIGELAGSRGGSSTTICLKGHRITLLSKLLSLYTQIISAVSRPHQRSMQWMVVHAETHKWSKRRE